MKGQFDISKMRTACRSAAETLAGVGSIVRSGITTDEIDRWVRSDTLKRGGYPATFNYHGFAKSCCTSVNDVVCHGIPGKYILKEGDVVNVDVTTILDDHFGDTSAMFCVGEVDQTSQRLILATERAMYAGIEAVRPGLPLNNVGRVIQAIAQEYGYSVVREFGGHGIGTRFHTVPHVNHFDSGDDSVIMEPGMVITVEPMINAGTADIWIDPDGWTVRTKDGQRSAQFEMTVLVTEEEPEVLTRRP